MENRILFEVRDEFVVNREGAIKVCEGWIGGFGIKDDESRVTGWDMCIADIGVGVEMGSSVYVRVRVDDSCV